MYITEIELSGRVVDAALLSRIINAVTEMDAKFSLCETRIGRTADDAGYARLEIGAPTCERLDEVIDKLKELGAVPINGQTVTLATVAKDGVGPDGFYSSTNIDTYVNISGKWVPVDDIEMDCVVVVDPERSTARCCPIAALSKGDQVVIGHGGVRVASMDRTVEERGFSFMGSDVSSERQKSLMVEEIAREIRAVRERNGKVLVVAGPAVIHTGAGKHLAALIDAGYVNVFFAGNAVAVHDVEAALLGTSLGVNLKDGISAPEGHMHHMLAINRIRSLGGLRQAVDAGILKEGVMHALVKNNVPFVLAGSIRDDGPLPDVITDSVEAQKAMRQGIKGVEIALMMSTMLHSIATGNLLPARVKTICIDINPATVTKLADRGSHQSIGIVSDVEWFLKELRSYLIKPDECANDED
ncbi:MAG: TIGR00300 family protein [Clostridia bacterium]|jgi:lysine-ketoglutarate reductase/saccharopine dehydrogenase-like protein (TIGR00300 family)|nr:TIGR00300 family protein [Clostridiales bacterium]